MATTSVYGLRYPEPTDPTTPAVDMRHLAEDVETQLVRIDADVDTLQAHTGKLPAQVQVGAESVSFATATSHIRTVLFPEAFDIAPSVVVANIATGSGDAIGWITKTDSYTTTSFRLLLSGGSSAWSGITVNYIAVAI